MHDMNSINVRLDIQKPDYVKTSYYSKLSRVKSINACVDIQKFLFFKTSYFAKYAKLNQSMFVLIFRKLSTSKYLTMLS